MLKKNPRRYVVNNEAMDRTGMVVRRRTEKPPKTRIGMKKGSKNRAEKRMET